jgi:hypothetical protein
VATAWSAGYLQVPKTPSMLYDLRVLENG